MAKWTVKAALDPPATMTHIERAHAARHRAAMRRIWPVSTVGMRRTEGMKEERKKREGGKEIEESEGESVSSRRAMSISMSARNL